MVTSEQKQAYSKLHDQLNKVYLKKEKHREDTLAFYTLIKPIYSKMKKEWERAKDQNIENKIDEIVFKSKQEHASKAVRGFNHFMHRFDAYLSENLKTYEKVEDTMRDMIAENKRLGTAQVSYKESGEILSGLEIKINDVSKKIDEAENALTMFKDELNSIKSANETIKLLDEFENIASDISIGIAPPGITQALEDTLDKNKDMLYFLFNIYRPWHKEAKAALLEVMERQLPEIKTNTNKHLRQFIKDINMAAAHSLIYSMRKLVKSHEEGMVLSEKYPKLDRWREFYCKPERPHYVKDTPHYHKRNMTAQEWEAYKQFENEKLDIIYKWKEKRKQEWYDAMQPLNFKYFPELNELEGDYWVLYAVHMRDNYELWKEDLEKIETVLDYGMNPEILFQPLDDLIKAIGEIDWETLNKLEEKREQRIYEKDFEKYNRKQRYSTS